MNLIKEFFHNFLDILLQLAVIALIIAFSYALLRWVVLVLNYCLNSYIQHVWTTLDVFLVVVIFGIIAALLKTIFAKKGEQ